MVKESPGSSDGLLLELDPRGTPMKAQLFRAAIALSALVALATVTGASKKFH
jgi:hypothetical protein